MYSRAQYANVCLRTENSNKRRENRGNILKTVQIMYPNERCETERVLSRDVDLLIAAFAST